MRDRLPAPGKENRVRITQDNGQVVEGVLSYADGATQAGSAYTKGNVLPDDVCGLLGIDPVTAEPKDAWVGVISALGYSVLNIEVQDIDGTPAAGVQVSGLTGVLDAKTYTGADGKIFLILKEGGYTLSVPKFEGCIDATMTPVSVSVGAGEIKTVTLKPISNGTKSITITSSQTVKFSSNVTSVDVFCVGGGGGGGGGSYLQYSNTSHARGGGGGGGGYTETKKGITPTPYTDYYAAIAGSGSGGDGAWVDSSSTSFAGGFPGKRGGSTSFLGCLASGGGGGDAESGHGTEPNGGSGGSGGGGGGYSSAGNGGSDGADGEAGNKGSGGRGQGRTTRAFGEPGGTLYSDGGGGATESSSGSSGSAGYGYGGGGGRGSRSGSAVRGSSGGSGIILARLVTKV